MVKYITEISELKKLKPAHRKVAKKVVEKYSFRSNDYYLSLINWDDPDDPIKRLIIPDVDEINDWGELDPSNEEKYTIIQGLEHKYDSTALLLVSDVCAGICRYCFRKRIFLDEEKEKVQDLNKALDYIKEHKEITNVLLTGGDALILSTNRLKEIINKLWEIEHVKIIRLGSKIPAFNPYRIIDDPKLLTMLANNIFPARKIYVMTHFNHPRELTKEAIKAINLLKEAGVLMANQTPIIRGINDSSKTLARLFKKLSFVGVPPYYVFQCRPAVGNKEYSVPIEEAYDIFEKAKARTSGLAKRASYVMSHASGKIEIVGKDAQNMYFKYRRAFNNADSGKFMVLARNPKAYWFDDYKEKKREETIIA